MMVIKDHSERSERLLERSERLLYASGFLYTFQKSDKNSIFLHAKKNENKRKKQYKRIK
jgi:hypothetical protein